MKINGRNWPAGLSKKFTRYEFVEKYKKMANEASLNHAYDKMVEASGDEKKPKADVKK